MMKHRKQEPRFAICINTDDPDLLTPRMVYEVVPDENAAKSNYIRVIDNEGEDYLYPASYFVSVDLPAAVGQALLCIPFPVSQGILARHNHGSASLYLREKRSKPQSEL